MKISTTEKGGRLTVYLSGELDHHESRETARELMSRLETIMPRDCIMDLRGVRFMDSSGIAVILQAYRRMQELGGRLWVENVPSQPLRVLDASGIERMISINTAG